MKIGEVIARKGVQYVVIPKNACTSIIALLCDLQDKTTEEVHKRTIRGNVPWDPEAGPTFAVIRHPWRRLVSTWANKVYQPHKPDTGLIRDHGFTAGMTFPKFLDEVERRGVRNVDIHIMPQADYLPSGPVDLLRFEALAADWESRPYLAKLGTLPRMNRSNGAVSATLDQVTRVRAMYKEDFFLCDKLTSLTP